MTAQISDSVFFEGQEFQIIGIEGSALFSPVDFGMQPEMRCTACYRGFHVKYELADGSLYLKELYITEANGKAAPLGGVSPEYHSNSIMPDEACYYGLKIPIPFTGKIRIAKDFIPKMYVHMGFQKASAYKTVLDITLEEGQVVEGHDRSKEAKKIRGNFKKRYEAESGDHIIFEAFETDMDFK